MSTTVKYKCDRCGGEQSSHEDFWEIRAIGKLPLPQSENPPAHGWRAGPAPKFFETCGKCYRGFSLATDWSQNED